MTEHDEQSALMLWIRSGAVLDAWPELEYLYAVPNGGWRHKRTARIMKAEGLKRGVPDLHLPVSRGGYHGLWIEMKFGKNRPTADQKKWLEFLEGQGHMVGICYSFEQAQAFIIQYLALESPETGPRSQISA